MYPSTTAVTFNQPNAQNSPVIFNSRLYEHNTNPYNDHLYQPLRNAVTHPSHQYQYTHKIAEEHALQRSHVSHQYRHLSNQDYDKIKNQTITTNQPLKATDHYQKIANKQYFILDAEERQGQPISEQKMKQIISKSRLDDQVIVYEKDHPQRASKHKAIDIETKKSEPVKVLQPIEKKAKYNLYSMLDEPFQRIKTNGCKAFKCAQNECIASETKYSWFD